MSSQAVQPHEAVRAPMPGRGGIAPSRVWLPQGQWRYVGEFLLQRFPHLDSVQMLQRIERGDIVDARGHPVHYYTPYRPQQWLWYYRVAENEVPVPFPLPILYVDDYLVVVDKPHFLPSIPSGQYLEHTAIARVRKHFNNYDITPLHRLDRETAGVMLFCVQPRYRGVYQALFQSQDIQKEYEAIAPVPPDRSFPLQVQRRIQGVPGQILMQCVEGPPNSDTYIELLSQWQTDIQLGHFRLQPLTGRKHQLRVHMHSLGAPIINDRWYACDGESTAPMPMSSAIQSGQSGEADFKDPLQLLARSIAFIDPISGEYREFYSERTLEWLPTASSNA